MNHPSTLVHIPPDSGICEVERTDVGKIEEPILRSDSERDEVIAGRSARLASMELASLLDSFRTPRCFREIRRNFGIFMLLLDQVRWWCDNRLSASWLLVFSASGH